MRPNKKLAILIFFLFVLTFILLSFHHHNDNAFHSFECGVCYAISILHFALFVVFPVLIVALERFFIILHSQKIFLPLLKIENLFGRAPPNLNLI
jgi:hypothetical protein